MKFSVLFAAALASVAIASPVAETEADAAPLETREQQLDARQRGDCAVGVYFGDYGCYFNTSSGRHFIGVCDRGGVVTRIAWCPGECKSSGIGYPYCA